jgi:hypothetical protein
MSSEAVPVKRSHAALIGDACLLTAATFALVTLPGLLFVAFGAIGTGPEGPADALSAMLAGIVSFMALIGVFLGPALAWVLHGRRLRWETVAWGVIGVIVAAGTVVALSAGVASISMSLTPFARSEFAVPITLTALLGLAFVALALALDLDAVRDLAGKHVHERLDRARIGATATLIVFFLALLPLSSTRPEIGMGQAGIFALAAGVFGGVIVAVVEGIETVLEARSRRRDGASAA